MPHRRRSTTSRGRIRWSRVLLVVSIVFMLLWTLTPFMYLLLCSVKTNLEITSVPPVWFPARLHLEDYRGVLFGTGDLSTPAGSFRYALRNSMIISIATMLICIATSCLAGYALERLDFPGRGLLSIGMLVLQMLPFVAMLLPLYLLVNSLQLRDTLWGLILVNSAFVCPYATWIMRTFIATIPRELEEAALIDGAGRITALVKVIMPPAAPGAAAVAVVAFLGAWDEFFAGLIFTSTTRAMPMTVLMTLFSSRSGADLGLMATGVALAIGPPVLLTLLFQRYLVAGLTAGAVKG